MKTATECIQAMSALFDEVGIDELVAELLAGKTALCDLDDTFGGVYFLFKGNDVIYVGKSIDVDSRIRAHRKCPSKDFDSFTVVSCPRHMMDTTEALFISKLRPPENRLQRHHKTIIDDE